MNIDIRISPGYLDDDWTLINADGEFQGLEAQKPMGTIREVSTDIQQAADSMTKGSNAAITLNGSKQEVPAIRKDVSNGSVTRCICEKRIGEDGKPYIAIIGKVSEEIRLLSTKR